MIDVMFKVRLNISIRANVCFLTKIFRRKRCVLQWLLKFTRIPTEIVNDDGMSPQLGQAVIFLINGEFTVGNLGTRHQQVNMNVLKHLSFIYCSRKCAVTIQTNHASYANASKALKCIDRKQKTFRLVNLNTFLCVKTVGVNI